MGKLKKGEMATVLTVGGLIALAAATIFSSIFLQKNKKPQTFRSKAYEQTPPCRSECRGIQAPATFDPAHYCWDIDCDNTKGYLLTNVDGATPPIAGSCYWTDDTSDRQAYNKFCRQSTDPEIYPPTSNWCYPFGEGHENFRCMMLKHFGEGGNPPGTVPPEPPTATPRPIPTATPRPGGGGGGRGTSPPATSTPTPTPDSSCTGKKLNDCCGTNGRCVNMGGELVCYGCPDGTTCVKDKGCVNLTPTPTAIPTPIFQCQPTSCSSPHEAVVYYKYKCVGGKCNEAPLFFSKVIGAFYYSTFEDCQSSTNGHIGNPEEDYCPFAKRSITANINFEINPSSFSFCTESETFFFGKIVILKNDETLAFFPDGIGYIILSTPPADKSSFQIPFDDYNAAWKGSVANNKYKVCLKWKCEQGQHYFYLSCLPDKEALSYPGGPNPTLSFTINLTR